MAELHELIEKIENPELRAQIAEAAKRALKHKQFGLVFEEHLPECTPLYDIPVRKGAKVSLRNGKANETFTVLKIEDGIATCLPKNSKEAVQFTVTDLVTTAELGDPIYPCLQPLGEVCNAPDSELWHTLIEADNYHALQLLEYLYAGKVDCIYIDPPYNTRAKDWKYNNDYVDPNDSYRHSKWLAMMQKRLALAKRLMNPASSVLIVTIDEKEYLHLGCLLEEMFEEAKIQMISSVINPAGAGKKEFARTDEYIFFVRLGSASVLPESREVENVPVIWDTLRRSSLANARGKHGKGACGPNQFYPIYVNDLTGKIEHIGDPIAEDVDRHSVPTIAGCTAVFPVRPDGTEMNWGIKPDEAEARLRSGYLRAGAYKPNEPQQYVISYLTGGIISDIEAGIAITEGYNEDGTIIAYYPTGKDKMPTTNWNRSTHDAQRYGTNILSKFIGNRFQYPKSVYAVKDALSYFVKENSNALIVDFFAGSGTTLHAVNLMNAEDGGQRRCILVTNNEVSADEEKQLTAAGYSRGDDEWNNLGIARYVTWPRAVCSILGRDIDGNPIEGDYGVIEEDYVVDEEDTVVSKKTGKPITKRIYARQKVQKLPKLAAIKRADGFKANAVFFKLGFLDKTKVSLGMQFKELLSTLWMKAGAIGKCPTIDASVPDMLILPNNKMAILNDENQFGKFAEQLTQHPEIEVVYLVTDYESSFVSMTQALDGKTTYQLYKDYLDNFRINAGRNSR
ncbi:site-specific DNA-methyltransferase [Anaeromassilibacillus senegalensis]|uniref:Site-specific DNA-methyltransferase n=1 Tax=Anaeromassilibacillus senegalensis TaxID=1673717 RepID=A0ABS9CLP6_9FIRM|nr:DNA methyltransferase [Anaeromassilibacillus senegalensis]MCF2651285.1 site-specific DNA-methyltransferase [Anaeromassilibacillus senegalensis]